MKTTIEGLSWSWLVGHNSVPPYHSSNLIRDLQEIHDCKEPKDWELELSTVANKFGLKFDYV